MTEPIPVTQVEEMGCFEGLYTRWLIEPCSRGITQLETRFLRYWNDTFLPVFWKVAKVVFLVAIGIFAGLCLYYPFLALPVLFGLGTYYLVSKVDSISSGLKDINEVLNLLQNIRQFQRQKMIIKKIKDDLQRIPLMRADVNIEDRWEAQAHFLNNDEIPVQDFEPSVFANEKCSITNNRVSFPVKVGRKIFDARVYFLLERENLFKNSTNLEYQDDEWLALANHSVRVSLRNTHQFDV